MGLMHHDNDTGDIKNTGRYDGTTNKRGGQKFGCIIVAQKGSRKDTVLRNLCKEQIMQLLRCESYEPTKGKEKGKNKNSREKDEGRRKRKKRGKYIIYNNG